MDIWGEFQFVLAQGDKVQKSQFESLAGLEEWLVSLGLTELELEDIETRCNREFNDKALAIDYEDTEWLLIFEQLAKRKANVSIYGVEYDEYGGIRMAAYTQSTSPYLYEFSQESDELDDPTYQQEVLIECRKWLDYLPKNKISEAMAEQVKIYVEALES